MSYRDLPMRQSTAAFILNDQSQILLVQPVSYAKHEWSLPGGGIEGNETAHQAVLREIAEEIGITRNQLRLVGQSRRLNTYEFDRTTALACGFSGQIKHQFVFECAKSIVIAVRAEEIRCYQWVPLTMLRSKLVFAGQFENARSVLVEFEYLESFDSA